MKLAYITLFDGTDVRNWSGLDLHIWKSLAAQGIDVELIGNLRHGRSLRRHLRKGWGTWVERRAFLHLWDVDTARGYAADVADRLAGSRSDVVLSPSPIPLAFLECPQPRVLWTDATFAGLASFYPEFSPNRLSRAATRSGHEIDRRSLDNCDVAIYSSDWAASTATTVRGTAPVLTVPYGANLDVSHSNADVDGFVSERSHRVLTLLFIGMDWIRKGGEHAVAVAAELVRRGVPVRLILVGAKPPDSVCRLPFVNYKGVVDKTSPDGRGLLSLLLRSSHFLILPSQAECCAVVLAEACGHGLPIVTTRVGGQGAVVTDGENGRLYDVSEVPSRWADWIEQAWSDDIGYARLARAAFQTYANRCNWQTAGATVANLLAEMMAQRRGTAAEVAA